MYSLFNDLAFNYMTFEFHDPLIDYIFAKKHHLNQKIHLFNEIRIALNSFPPNHLNFLLDMIICLLLASNNHVTLCISKERQGQ